MEDWRIKAQAVMEVQLGPVAFTGTSASTQYYDRPILAAIDDWYAPAKARSSTTDSPVSHGGHWTGPQRLGTKTLQLTGWLASNTRMTVADLKTQLAALIIGNEYDLAVTTEERRTHRKVRILDIDVPDDHGKGVITWAIDVEAADPRRYGDLQSIKEEFDANGAQYNVIGNPRPHSATDYYGTDQGGVEWPADLRDGYVETSFDSEAHAAMFYRCQHFTKRIMQVRMEVRAPYDIPGSLTLAWWDSQGRAIETISYPEVIIKNDWTLVTGLVSQPSNAVGFDMGISFKDHPQSVPITVAMRRLMAGRMTLREFYSTGPGVEQPAPVVNGWAEGSSPDGKVTVGTRVSRQLAVTRLAVTAKASRPIRACLTVSHMDGPLVNQTVAFPDVAITTTGTLLTAQLPPSEPHALTVGVSTYDTDSAEPVTLSVKDLPHEQGQSGAWEYQDGDSNGWTWEGPPGNSASSQVGTRWHLDNSEGTASSVPSLKFTTAGSIAGFRLKFFNDAREFVYRHPINAGSEVELIPNEHAIIIDGVLAPYVAGGDWPVVEAGTIEDLSLMPLSQSPFTATCDWAPAWW